MSTKTQTAGRIVVGTDRSQRANKAVTWAAEQAVARRLPLLVVYAHPLRQLMGSAANTLILAYAREEFELAKTEVGQLVDSLRESYPGLAVEAQVVEGNPSYVLAESSRDAELVVVGARGESAPWAVRTLGGVSDAVVAHAHGPVAVIQDEALENPRGPVVVGVDDSEPAMAAVKLGFDAAAARGVPLVALHGYTSASSEAVFDPSLWDPSGEEFKQALTDQVTVLLANEAAAHPDVPVEVRIEQARPQDALVEASKEAGLVVVGSRGRGGFRGLLLGSTSKHVLREAHCPVIVTRGHKDT